MKAHEIMQQTAKYPSRTMIFFNIKILQFHGYKGGSMESHRTLKTHGTLHRHHISWIYMESPHLE